ncbi:MAG: GDP-mannose 4,6-dehydratase [Chloracidobacterium sp.]|nr:GDP-mannose 4,6-dehydratase [Chloracidobacterium sp.]
MKKVLITGINGQDGSYLAELLLEKGYQVFGLARQGSSSSRIEPIRDRIELVEGDISDLSGLSQIFADIRPDEVYNLAAQSHVGHSFQEPVITAKITGVGAVNVFEAARLNAPLARIYQASSSEMFGDSVDDDGCQRETTRMDPGSPYACSKVFAYMMARNYRAAYGMFIANGILFNHESPRRGINFVTNKVCREAVRIKLGLADTMPIGNLDVQRDWGHAKDYVRAMWLMLQQERSDDYVCATGSAHTVSELVEYVFGSLGLDWNKLVEIEPSLVRTEDRRQLKVDSMKLRTATGWSPTYTFESMLDEMIEYWLTRFNDAETATA